MICLEVLNPDALKTSLAYQASTIYLPTCCRLSDPPTANCSLSLLTCVYHQAMH